MINNQIPKYNLDDMLNDITPENCHSLLLDYAPAGSEAW